MTLRVYTYMYMYFTAYRILFLHLITSDNIIYDALNVNCMPFDNNYQLLPIGGVCIFLSMKSIVCVLACNVCTAWVGGFVFEGALHAYQ